MGAFQIGGVDGAEGLVERGAQHALVDEVGDVVEQMCCAIMSGVWNDERVNINSQCTEIALPLKALMVNSGGSSIRPNLPCGAMKSAIAL